MAAMRVLLFLTCVHIAASDDVINVTKLELGSLVSGHVSLQASDTYSLMGTMPYRVKTTISGVAASVVFVVREQEDLLKWMLPSNADSFRSNISSLTAEHTFVHCSQSSSAVTYIDVFTDSAVEVYYTLFVDELVQFNLSISEFYTTVLMVAQPEIYYFEFPSDMTAVTVNVTSNDTNTCAFVSVQNTPICPPVDTLYDSIVIGIDQSMTTNAFITITRDSLNEPSFYVVLIPASFALCHGSLMSDENGESYMKHITFSVQQAETLSMHQKEIWLPIGILIGGSVIISIVYCFYCCSCDKDKDKSSSKLNNLKGFIQHCVYKEDKTISKLNCYCFNLSETKSQSQSGSSDTTALQSTIEIEEGTPGSSPANGNTPICNSEDVSVSSPVNEHHVPTVELINKVDDTDAQQISIKAESDLRMSDFTDDKLRSVQVSHVAYICNTITVGIYYGIPALQVVLAKSLAQQMLPVYEEDEMCYYNYQCAIAYRYIPAFNNVLSNSGYVILGIAFIIIVGCRNIKDDFNRTGNGLYCSMGCALVGEGVMSALYHVCPSDINFQFDTTFMFVIGGLIIAKVVQNRHPYFNANSFCAFFGFSVITFFTVIGLYVDRYNPVAIRISLLFILLIIAVAFSVSLYYYNQLSLLFDNLSCEAKLPKRKWQVAVLTVVLLLDLIVLLCVVCSNELLSIPTAVLFLFAINAGVMFLWYTSCKCWYSEPMMTLPTVILAFALLLWICAFIFFRKKIYSSGMTPAESRELNKPCYSGGFYDYHDLWHFMSAAAMFATFMGMLTLDDGLQKKKRDEIHAF